MQTSPWLFWLAIGLAWLVGVFGGGAALAWLYRRLHPELSFYKLWAVWAAVLNGVAALLIGLGVVRL